MRSTAHPRPVKSQRSPATSLTAQPELRPEAPEVILESQTDGQYPEPLPSVTLALPAGRTALLQLGSQLVGIKLSWPLLPQEARRLSRFTAPLCLAILLAAVALLYAPTLDDPFHGDDFVAFTDFKTESLLKYSEDVFLFKDSNFYWRPLGKVFHYAIFAVAGFDPTAFRAAGLAIFLGTLVCLYVFCRRATFDRLTALAAVAVFGLGPNHVVSVAWVTNTSRLMALFFLMLCLLLLQTRRRAVLVEVGAWLFFVAAVVSDEVRLALAPVPLLYATFLRDDRIHWRSALLRLVPYAVVVCVLIPLQLSQTLNDEPRLSLYGIGAHIPSQTWALVSQLTLPLTPATPVDVILLNIPPTQWAAGAVAIAAGAVLLVAGSRMTRFLVLWTAISLAPFALWDLSYTSPRYVYLASPPFAILVAWLFSHVVALAPRVISLRGIAPKAAGLAFAGALAVVLAVAAIVSSDTLRDRNAAWGAETEQYGALADGLQQRLATVPPGSRIVIFYGPWPDFWSSSLAQTLYGDRSIRVVGIPAERVDLPMPPFRKNDYVFYYVGKKLILGGLTSTTR